MGPNKIKLKCHTGWTEYFKYCWFVFDFVAENSAIIVTINWSGSLQSKTIVRLCLPVYPVMFWNRNIRIHIIDGLEQLMTLQKNKVIQPSGRWTNVCLVAVSASPLFLPGETLQCYTCMGSNNEDCNRQGSKTCPSYSDACALVVGRESESSSEIPK